MTTVESEAAFAARALTIGLEPTVLEKIKQGGLNTFGKFAYSCAYQPGSSEEKPFVDLLTTVLGAQPTVRELAVLRRLYFESHALSVADLRTRVASREDDQPKKMPAPERAARLAIQRLALVGLDITGHNEPANSLVDRCVQQLEEGQLRHIPLNECPSRPQEILNVKKDSVITFDAQGSIRLNKRDLETKTDVSSDLKIQAAFLRRALAYDQAGLISFSVLNNWATRCFDIMARDPPAGYRRVTMEQILTADKELFVLTADATRADLVPLPGAQKPADVAIKALIENPKVQYLLLPLPGGHAAHSSSSSELPKRPAPYEAKGYKGGGKGKKGKDFKGSSTPSVPQGCVTKDGNKRPICFSFNTSGCKYAKPGARCRKGMHVCWKDNCFKNRPFSECQH
jgi:hypothetical protein